MVRGVRGRIGWVLALIAAAGIATVDIQGQRGRGPQPPPEISGKWTGTWSSFNPAQATTQPKELCKQLDAEIVKNGDVWVATFEGDCGRPYKYKISMNGRLSGGVYDWVGRATNGEFIGFYTSAHATGFFNLSRAK